MSYFKTMLAGYYLHAFIFIQMKPGFKKQQLSVINAELVKAGEGLMKLSTYPERCKCLKVLSKSADLIKWLKSETGS